MSITSTNRRSAEAARASGTRPTAAPTAAPDAQPTAVPGAQPTAAPTAVPAAQPTAAPTAVPTAVPAAHPAAVDDRAAVLVDQHLGALAPVLVALRAEAPRLSAWGTELAARLMTGGRLLTAGNGGSAAEAQHLSAELVGRFDADRRPFSAIALHADTSSVTAIANDYGYDQVFARQVAGHGRAGDVLLLLSTSGLSANLLRAADAAHDIGITTWALTGRGPNPLCEACDDHIALPGPSANVQEAQLIAVHAVCRAFDYAVSVQDARDAAARDAARNAAVHTAAAPKAEAHGAPRAERRIS